MYNRNTVDFAGAVHHFDWKAIRQPPRPLLAVLYSFTTVCICLLGWLEWRLIDQEKLVESQRSQERIEQEADRLVATLRSVLADLGERLDAWDSSAKPPSGAIVISERGGTLAASGGTLLFLNSPAALAEADPQVFAEPDQLEFALAKPAEALALDQALTLSGSPAIRAAALVRTARIHRRLGDAHAVRLAYEKLAGISNVLVAGAPADLVARTELQDPGVGRNLLRGRWQLTRDQLEYYWSRVSSEPLPSDPLALSGAASLALENGKRNGASRGEETLRVGDQSFLVLWRGKPERRTWLLAPAATFVPKVSRGVAIALYDPEGRAVAGTRDVQRRAAVRMAAEMQIPWTVYVTAPNTGVAALADQRRFLTLEFAFMIAFLLLGSHFIGKAIRREAQISRMQSDFVSTVSHEFRSPLTSIRQLSELLSDGRVVSERRRQTYYETLVTETTRLQRLVEGLLNFGRMEAGAKQYVFETLDVAQIVEQVAAEFGVNLAASGRRIETIAPRASCLIEADPDAIAVALRNLLDNALKYSPQDEPVSVEWHAREGFIAIEVRDRGCGIPEAERRIIFKKFVRGSAAQSVNVKGSGVGLAMVRHIVIAHGGAISVQSEPGRGSAFTMLLRTADRT